MKIAIEGCAHGELDAIYSQLAALEKERGESVDCLLICGDFEAIRNSRDLQCMAVPPKYRVLGGFHKYYTGEKVAPVLTIVIGGNHEASNYLWELYHGGWLAPNIYFLGHAGCVQLRSPEGALRIAGASGIFKGHDFASGHPERVPYDNGTMRSIYHTREYDIRRLSLLPSADIFLSHDWPQHIAYHGDTAGLVRRKRFFDADIRSGRLGSPPLMGLLRSLRPRWWFAAHLHVRFEARVVHEGGVDAEQETEKEKEREEVARRGQELASTSVPPPVANPDEIAIDIEEDEEETNAGDAVVPQACCHHGAALAAADDDDDDDAEMEEVARAIQPSASAAASPFVPSLPLLQADANPDEIMLVDSDLDDALPMGGGGAAGVGAEAQKEVVVDVAAITPANPDEILLSDEEEYEAVRAPATLPPVAVQTTAKDVNGAGPARNHHRGAGAPPPPPPVAGRETRYLALDKCLPRRQFLEIVDIPCLAGTGSAPSSGDGRGSATATLHFDAEWLAIQRAFHPWFSTARAQRAFPPEAEARALVAEARAWVEENVLRAAASSASSSLSPPASSLSFPASSLRSPASMPVEEVQQFVMTAPGPSKETESGPARFQQPPHYVNPQTVAFCRMLGVEDKINGGSR